MKERYLTPSAVILMLIKTEDGKNFVLLQRRQNTGFADGMWDMSSSGHVEHGENMTATVLRETREEIGLQLNSNDVHFVTLIHKREEERDLTYYNGYFVCENFKGEPTICEPSKCSELKWFPIDNLPDDLIVDRKLALNALAKKIPYIEFGWNNK